MFTQPDDEGLVTKILALSVNACMGPKGAEPSFFIFDVFVVLSSQRCFASVLIFSKSF